VLTVGDATATRARAAGFRLVVSAGGDAKDLARLAKARLPRTARPILLAVGESQGNALADELRTGGFRVLRRVVYSVVPAQALTAPAVAALRAGHVRAALFFSAETARHFVQLVQRARVGTAVRSVEAISIGRPAAMALEQLTWRRIRIAARPNQDEMLALLR
jgi:uroporphyrinogen-III synthase